MDSKYGMGLIIQRYSLRRGHDWRFDAEHFEQCHLAAFLFSCYLNQ